MDIRNRVLSIFDKTKDGNVLTRYELWNKAWEYFKLSPFIGIGFGRFNDINFSFTGIKNLFYIAIDSMVVYHLLNAHNSYFHILSELGYRFNVVFVVLD